MNTQLILAELIATRDRVNAAIAALTGDNRKVARVSRKGKRTMSALARKRLSRSMRKTWAAKRAKTNVAKNTKTGAGKEGAELKAA